MAFESLIRPGIRAIHPYTPGKPAEELERELGIVGALKFASNENPHGPSPLALEAIRESMGGLNRYGDAGCFYLRQELSRQWGLPDDHFVVLNGSSEGIYLSAALTCTEGDEIIYAHPPSFLLYRMSAQYTGATPVTVPLRDLTHDLAAMRAAISPKTRLVFISNPNNPTGTAVGQREVEAFLDGIPEHVLVVFDHAYREYATRADFPDLRPLMRKGRAIVEMRTFSKAYSLAGLRVAYIAAHPSLADFYNRARLPFNVNALAQVAALAALKDQHHVRHAVEVNAASLQRISETLTEFGATVVPSQANFLLVRLASDARPIQAEMERRGVIVRNMVAFGLPPEYLRITSGTKTQTDRLLQVLREVLTGAPAGR